MQITEFHSIVRTFIDPGSALVFDNSDFCISVNGDLISAKLLSKHGDVFISEGSDSEPEPASKWVINRLARLPLLASRLRETVHDTDHFVSPSVSLLATLENRPDEHPMESQDGLATFLDALNQATPFETSVLYLTSHAGEGKTSLINQATRVQAQRFIDHASDWLLVPIPLGGRHFLRFDDITVGVMQNRYRFPFLYYQSFLALVRMGVIVPAFDGFEEMFVESNSGEALSAMGVLVGSLDSRGTLAVAARKAYFEFEDLRSQERLLDTIKTHSVGFGKLDLHRWAQSQFVSYCRKRDVAQPQNLYDQLSTRLSPEHALLTRAVLVKGLIDVVKKSATFTEFVDQLRNSGPDYFYIFVRGLIEREANEKWLDRDLKDGIGSPLFTVDEHCELLSHVALTMWESKVDYIKPDALEFVADYFCELKRKNAFQSQQVRERVRGHAMLVTSPAVSGAVEFDHDEFRLFFLAEGIARQIEPLNTRAKAEVWATFRRGAIPADAMSALYRAVTRAEHIDKVQVARFLLDVANMDAQASYTQENVSGVLLKVLCGVGRSDIEIKGLTFQHDALRDIKLIDLKFRDCYFAGTSVEMAELRSCQFAGCKFAQLKMSETFVAERVEFADCTIEALTFADTGRESWDPAEIQQQLEQAGISFPGSPVAVPPVGPAREPDAELVDLEKIVRYFGRSTHISEGVVRIKLSSRGQTFMDEVLPILLKCGALVEIQNLGAGDQRRFRLNSTPQDIAERIAASGGDFQMFVQRFADSPSV